MRPGWLEVLDAALGAAALFFLLWVMLILF